MSDVECPYCGEEQEINHDDGYGFQEDKIYEQECHNCEKTFVYTTMIHMTYRARKADCINGDADHNYKPTFTFPRQYTKMVCRVCDHERDCTKEEMAEVLKNE